MIKYTLILPCLILCSSLGLATRAKGLEVIVKSLWDEKPRQDVVVTVYDAATGQPVTSGTTDSTGYANLWHPIMHLPLTEISLSTSPPETTASFPIQNKGIGPLNSHITTDATWLSIDKDSLSTWQADTVNVTANPNNFEAGDYSGNIIVTSNAGTDTVKVNMEVVGINEGYEKPKGKLSIGTLNNPSQAPSVTFYLPKETQVSLKLFNVAGSKVKDLLTNQTLSQGFYSYTSTLNNGIYFYHLKTPEQAKTAKVVVVGSQGSGEGLLEKLSNDNDKNNQGLSSRLSFNENEKRTLSPKLLNTDDPTVFLIEVLTDGHYKRELFALNVPYLNIWPQDTLHRYSFLEEVGRALELTTPNSPLYPITRTWAHPPDSFYIDLKVKDTAGVYSCTLSPDYWQVQNRIKLFQRLHELTKIAGKDSTFISQDPYIVTGKDPPYNQEGWLVSGFDDSQPGTGGGTGVDYKNEEIVSAYFWTISGLNPWGHDSLGATHYDLHEIGHALGLEHTHTISDSAVMWWGGYPGGWHPQWYSLSEQKVLKFLTNRGTWNQAEDKDKNPWDDLFGKGTTTYSRSHVDKFESTPTYSY
jgi:hypothetical protein